MTSRSTKPTGKAGKKGPKKDKAPAEEPKVPYDSLTVRDCMTWRYQKGYKGPTDAGGPAQEQNSYHLSKRPEVGRSKDRGYNTPPPHEEKENKSGTVVQAVRGWPGDRHNDEDPNGYYGEEPQQSNQKENERVDPYMGDLISHKFLNDSIRKKRQEEEEAMRKEQETARARKMGKIDAKGNRTSQLRAIALANKVEINPKDMWQMSRFKNAKPHITTQQEGKKERGGGGGGEYRSGSGYARADGGDPCLCGGNRDEIKDEEYFANYRPASRKYEYMEYAGDNDTHTPINGHPDPAFRDERNEEYMFDV